MNRIRRRIADLLKQTIALCGLEGNRRETTVSKEVPVRLLFIDTALTEYLTDELECIARKSEKPDDEDIEL